MKIDIGSEGKILGTKRVSPNGQVSGLSEYAGEEVLVIYPGPREPRIRKDPEDYLHELEAAVGQQMKGAFRQYKILKAKYKDEAAATADFIRAKSPKQWEGLIDNVDDWVKGQVAKAEKSVARKLGENEAGEQAL
ncbi:MAG: hypothetical protein QOD77_1051 [Thermoplasmata archaeon]|jgi:hypothetical protein|nr:hypothetical protein [Thermoplasmata archaeon]